MSCGSIYHLKQRIAALERQLAEAQTKLDHWENGVQDEDCPYLTDVKRAQGKLDVLMKAGVTDYSKLTGANRVDCHFCNGVWRTEEPAKHKSTCPLDAVLSKEGNDATSRPD